MNTHFENGVIKARNQLLDQYPQIFKNGPYKSFDQILRELPSDAKDYLISMAATKDIATAVDAFLSRYPDYRPSKMTLRMGLKDKGYNYKKMR